jgi:hypothetical protein
MPIVYVGDRIGELPTESQRVIREMAQEINTTAGYLFVGAGSPETKITGNVGALYLRTDGAAGTSLYVKQAASGANTGWTAIDLESYLEVSGGNAMTGALKLADGTASAPSLTFGSNTGTGLFRPAANVLGFAANGVEQARLTDNGRFQAGIFTTFNGTYIAAPHNTAVTLITLPNNLVSTWIVTAGVVANDVSNYTAVATVITNGTQSARPAALYHAGGLMSITLAGLDVQAAHSSWISANISWAATRVA